MRFLISPSPALSSASTTSTLRPPSKLPTTSIWWASRPAPSFRRLKLRCPPDETVALRPRCLVVRAQMNHDHGNIPNHFVEEFQTIVERFLRHKGRRTSKATKLYVPDDFQPHIDGVLFLMFTVCGLASEAVLMASLVVDSGRLTATGLSTKICADTVQRTVREYVNVFLCISKECYDKKLDRGTVTRYVGALRALGSISHILLEDALEALNHTDLREGLLEYNSDVRSIYRDFICKMDDLEAGIWNPNTSNPVQLALVTFDQAFQVTQRFLDLMLARRQRVFEKACGGIK